VVGDKFVEDEEKAVQKVFLLTEEVPACSATSVSPPSSDTSATVGVAGAACVTPLSSPSQSNDVEGCLGGSYNAWLAQCVRVWASV
jgi:hypothetical protein